MGSMRVSLLLFSGTREAMLVARRKSLFKGGKLKLGTKTQRQRIVLMAAGDKTSDEVGELLGVSRATVYRIVAKHRATEEMSA